MTDEWIFNETPAQKYIDHWVSNKWYDWFKCHNLITVMSKESILKVNTDLKQPIVFIHIYTNIYNINMQAY